MLKIEGRNLDYLLLIREEAPLQTQPTCFVRVAHFTKSPISFLVSVDCWLIQLTQVEKSNGRAHERCSHPGPELHAALGYTWQTLPSQQQHLAMHASADRPIHPKILVKIRNSIAVRPTLPSPEQAFLQGCWLGRRKGMKLGRPLQPSANQSRWRQSFTLYPHPMTPYKFLGDFFHLLSPLKSKADQYVPWCHTDPLMP